MNLLHIFKVNKRAEESGVSFADVQDAVSNYDPALHEAPIVIGHPKLDDPAYGWVESLSLSGQTVLAKPKQIVEEFADWVNQGLYKKISASFYGKTNPDNPTPGKLYLKHVGYLGAVPPKIKGMPDSSFSESSGEVLTLEFSELEFEDYDDRLSKLEASVFKGPNSVFAEQPRVPAGSSAGGQFASKTGGKSGGSPGLDEVDEVEIKSVGDFKPQDADVLAQGGAIAEGTIKVDAYSQHTKQDDRDEGISDEYNFGVSKEIASELRSNPDLLKKVVAIHAKHVSSGGSDDFIDIPGTDYKLWSDPSAPEIPSIFTNQQYENFSEQLMGKEQELEQREQAIALRERAVTLKEQELHFSEALDPLVASGQIPAAQKAAHLRRLKMLASIPPDNVMDFADGKTDYSPTAEYLAELKALPVIVNFSELAKDPPPEPTTDPQAIADGIKAEIKAARDNGESLSFAEAELRFNAKQNGGKA